MLESKYWDRIFTTHTRDETKCGSARYRLAARIAPVQSPRGGAAGGPRSARGRPLSGQQGPLRCRTATSVAPGSAPDASVLSRLPRQPTGGVGSGGPDGGDGGESCGEGCAKDGGGTEVGGGGTGNSSGESGVHGESGGWCASGVWTARRAAERASASASTRPRARAAAAGPLATHLSARGRSRWSSRRTRTVAGRATATCGPGRRPPARRDGDLLGVERLHRPRAQPRSQFPAPCGTGCSRAALTRPASVSQNSPWSMP